MKKIALLSDGHKRHIQVSWLNGIMAKIVQTDEDITLHQFNCFGNWNPDRKYNQGEYNIYHLPDLTQYDGIILDCNSTKDKDQLEKTIQLIRDSKVPTVSLTYSIEGFYYVGIDNRSPIIDIMNHLHDVHGCESFYFAGGPKGNFENQMRLSAFLEALRTFHITPDSTMYGHKDFEFNSGVYHMNHLHERGKKIPQAIICANDSIAIGVCETAKKLGYQIPGDFIVTGFDNFDNAKYYTPSITTVEHNRVAIGAAAVQILLDVWAGYELDQHHFVPTECRFAESCGCPNHQDISYRNHCSNQIISNINRQIEEEILFSLESYFSDCNDFQSMFAYYAHVINELTEDGFYIVVDRDIFIPTSHKEFSENGYDHKQLTMSYGMERGKSLVYYDYEEFKQHILEHGANASFLFSPIHFREQAIGFTVLKNGRSLLDNPLLYEAHISFNQKMEALYQKLKLNSAYVEMKEIYNRDSLTGLFNRTAYNDMIRPKFEKHQKYGIACAMSFFDADHFKEINDTYGHQYGDEVLKKMANIIQTEKPTEGFAFRFGGDEFVVFFPHASSEKIAEFEKRISRVFDEEGIKVSIGSILTNPSAGRSLDEYLTMADKKMYEIKEMRHKKSL